MSTPSEVTCEPLVVDGSNYTQWSAHILHILRTNGLLVEQIVDASILPPSFEWGNLSHEETMRLQLNARVANYMLSTLNPDTTSWLFKDYKRFEDAHDIWVTLKNEFACKTQEQANTYDEDSKEDAISLCDSKEDMEEEQEG